MAPGGRVAAAEPAVVKLVRDAQERLGFRVAIFVEVRAARGRLSCRCKHQGVQLKLRCAG